MTFVDLIGGLKVYVKTDVSPEVLVYDSRAPEKENKSGSIVKYQVRVTSQNGKEILNHGKAETNLVKVGIIYGTVVVGLFVIAKGLKGSYEHFKK